MVYVESPRVRWPVTGSHRACGRRRVRLGPPTSRMLTHWVVDDNHAQACPEASRHHMCKRKSVRQPA